MSLTHTQHRQSEQGFTLVELAIVMVIIGLLIGGILKGQELIANAKIGATVSQIKGLDAALNTFQDKYNGLAGDILSPDTRLPGCDAAPCNDAGNGDGRYTNVAGAAPATTDEGVVAFAQMSAADLISGVNTTTTETTPTFGGYLPAVKAGGGMWLGSSSNTGTATGGFTGLSANRPYAALNGTNAAVSDSSGAMTPTVAAQIDRKLDDGAPGAGSLRAVCNASGITGSGATAVYDEGVTNAACAMVARVMN